MRDSWTRVRLILSGEVRELLAAQAVHIRALQTNLQGTRTCIAAVAARLLEVSESHVRAAGVEAPPFPYASAQEVSASGTPYVPRLG
jgi:hypothetical protein